MIEQTISIERIEDVIDIFGSFDENIKLIEHELDVSVVSRDDQLKISGEAENVLYAVKAVQGLLGLAGRKETITEQNVRYIINLVKAGNEEHINDIARDVLCVTAKGKPIKPKTLGQKRYVDAIKKNTITLGIGPAGTGKTYLAMAQAVRRLLSGEVRRIVLTRPAVEAGENLEHAARREAKEETGIDLGEVRYLGSQPWPFPASLMMAFKAQALSTDILVDGEETETARWVTRDEYTIELSEGRMEAPGKSTIARYMIEEWYGREL